MKKVGAESLVAVYIYIYIYIYIGILKKINNRKIER